MARTLGDLAEYLGAELHGDAGAEVSRVATLASAGPGDVSFLSNRRYRVHLASTRASAVILERVFLDECPVAALVMENPYLGYARVATLLNPQMRHPGGVHPDASVSGDAEVDPSAWVGPQAVVESGAKLGPGVFVGPGCIVGARAEIGEDSRLIAHVTVGERVRIGRRALVHPGVVIGGDGFGIAIDGRVWVKVPQLGSVRIDDDVEIGANTTIDRGALDDTVIEDGVKLDNQIQVAHNVRIGAHTAIAACVAIGGSARIGRYCTIGGAASLAGHLEIADDVHLTATSAVPNSIRRPGVYSSGMPVQENREWRRNVVRMRQLDDMARRLRALERSLAGRGSASAPRAVAAPAAEAPAGVTTGSRERPGMEHPEVDMTAMDIHEVLKYLPHRYPMLLLDRVVECHPGKSLVAIKNVTYNEPFFQGHFPHRPVMPAVLILEAMAQATGILALRTLGELPTDQSIYYFVGVDNARFRRPVEPGDQLRIEVRIVRRSRGVWKVESDALVDGRLVAGAQLMGALREIEE